MKFTPYSFSKQNTFAQCPFKFKLQYIDKIKTPFKMNAILEKGSYIHLILEEIANNDGVLPEIEYKFKYSTKEEIQGYKVIAHDFIYSELGYKYLNPENGKFFGAEVEFGVKLVDGKWLDTNYYDKNAMFRGKIDHMNKLGERAEVIDWKSGKVNSDPAVLQVIMYAIWVFIKFPEVQEVDSVFVYVEHGQEKRFTFKRSHLIPLMKKLVEKIYNIEKAIKYPKTENGLCPFCQYRLSGDCEETSNLDFNDDLMKFAPKVQTKWFFMHPESGCAWIQDHPLREVESDGLVEEVDEDLFWQLEDLGYDIEREIKTLS